MLDEFQTRLLSEEDPPTDYHSLHSCAQMLSEAE